MSFQQTDLPEEVQLELAESYSLCELYAQENGAPTPPPAHIGRRLRHSGCPNWGVLQAEARGAAARVQTQDGAWQAKHPAQMPRT